MTLPDYVAAVETAFHAYGLGHAETPRPVHIGAAQGAFHVKSASLTLDRLYVAVKVNGNFPGNPVRHGLPTIQGVVALCDGNDGTVLAVMDSIEVTLRRTAAATALAARHLALASTETIGLCGCGAQGRAQLEALAAVMHPRRILVWDVDEDKARQLADSMTSMLSLGVHSVASAQEATRQSHVIVTATTARTPFLAPAMVPPGAFVAAVGADNPDKSEIAPELMAGAKVVVDLIDQAATMGDLHHAIVAGAMTAARVHAELSDIIVGRKAGRTSNDETIVFDSTGAGIQDVATAVAIWKRAIAEDVGSAIDFGAP